eukprot:3147173-Lingulodinium_polyedra.AAC.1
MSRATSRAAPLSCNTLTGACFAFAMSVLKHHNATSLVQCAKEDDDSILGPHDGAAMWWP